MKQLVPIIIAGAIVDSDAPYHESVFIRINLW